MVGLRWLLTVSAVMMSAVAGAAGDSVMTLSLRAQSAKDENPSFTILAESGYFPAGTGVVRMAFNLRRERRVYGYFAGTRVFSGPGVLDDERLHHLALQIDPGRRRLTLYVDGREADSAAIARDEAIAATPFAVGERVVKGSEDDEWYYTYTRTMTFRGRIEDAKLVPGAFDPAAVAGGCAPQVRPRPVPPPNPWKIPPKWERPKTTRRYLHAPGSERLLTFWREGKIVFGEVEHKDDWSVYYRRRSPDGVWSGIHSHAVWMVHGDRDEAFDFRAAELNRRDDGIPLHSQTWRTNGLEVTLSAAAPFVRRPSAFVKLTVANRSEKPVSERFAFLVREGLENFLVFSAPDVYDLYDPKLSDWDRFPASDWSFADGTAVCGDRRVAAPGAEWDAAKGALRYSFALRPGESREVEIVVGRGEMPSETFAETAERETADWRRELSRLRLGRIDAKYRPLVVNLAAQMLQCFASPTEGDFILPRQGGLQRFVWPGDAISFLGAMDLLGYGDWTARARDFYYDHCQRESGEAGPFANRWACDTATCLIAFANHRLRTGDEATWRRHLEGAMKAFGWIRAKRAEGGGLFPAMKSTDHGAASRHWGFTDIYNYKAMRLFAEALEKAGDPRAAEVRGEGRAYGEALQRGLDIWRKAAEGRDELRIPITVEGTTDDELFEVFMFYSHPGMFAESGLLTADEIMRLRTWMLRRGFMNENGLCQREITTRAELWNHVWYTTWSEQLWSIAYRRIGREDLAAKNLEACLRFAVTDEYYVGERYHDASPWYYPWSPNASGSGRIVEMLDAAAR